MKQIYLTVVTVITVICIIAGTYRNLIAPRHDYEYAEEPVQDYEEIPAPEEDWDGTIRTAIIDLPYGSLVLQGGDEFMVETSGDITEQLEWQVHDQELSVWLDEQDAERLEGSVVTITIPDTERPESLSVNLNLGDITIKNIDVENAELNCSLGNIKAENINLGEGTITSECGNVELSAIRFRSLYVMESLGNITIRSAEDLTDYGKHLSVEAGRITVNGSPIGTMADIEGNGDGNLSCENRMGNISVSW